MCLHLLRIEGSSIRRRLYTKIATLLFTAWIRTISSIAMIQTVPLSGILNYDSFTPPPHTTPSHLQRIHNARKLIHREPNPRGHPTKIRNTTTHHCSPQQQPPDACEAVDVKRQVGFLLRSSFSASFESVPIVRILPARAELASV